MNNLIPPHDIISRQCEVADIDRIYKEAARMLEMCHERRGKMQGAYAIANPQITKNDPLRFFVTKEGRIICNPVIKNHTKTTVDSEEFCYTFFYMEVPGKVQRYNVVEIEFEELIDDKFEKKEEKFSGKMARIFAHEIDHLNAIYIYPIDFDALKKEEEEYEEKKQVALEEKKVKEPIINQSIDILK